MGQRLTVNSFTFTTLLVQQKMLIEVNGNMGMAVGRTEINS
jgi:hypothetical protein